MSTAASCSCVSSCLVCLCLLVPCSKCAHAAGVRCSLPAASLVPHIKAPRQVIHSKFKSYTPSFRVSCSFAQKCGRIACAWRCGGMSGKMFKGPSKMSRGAGKRPSTRQARMATFLAQVLWFMSQSPARRPAGPFNHQSSPVSASRQHTGAGKG